MNDVFRCFPAISGLALTLLAAGCSGGSPGHPTPAQAYTLTVNSTHPASGVPVSISPPDMSSTSQGTTGFTLRYTAGASVTLTAPATGGGNNFSAWTGCGSANGATCVVTLNSDTTVTANYASPPP